MTREALMGPAPSALCVDARRNALREATITPASPKASNRPSRRIYVHRLPWGYTWDVPVESLTGKATFRLVNGSDGLPLYMEQVS